MKSSATFITSHTVARAVKQFVVACSANSNLQDAIASLYYLPENYTLVVDRDRADMEHEIDQALAHRIRFADDKQTGLDSVPFSFADATIEGGKISAAAGEPSNDIREQSPEAYASAILSVARAAA
ncbi:MAG TPA: hypothetical protein VIM53_00350 [Candidatus Saccharimonadales bacterium]